MAIEIRELGALLKTHLNGQKIAKSIVKNLTKPGENYGSLMLSVDLTLEDATQLHYVAKMVPPNEFIQKMFNTPVTFRNEIGLFKVIVPTLQQLLIEEGSSLVVDFAPQLISSRLSLKDDNEVDVDGAIIMENLKIENFTTVDRTEGMTFEEAKLVLQSLVQMHGFSLVLKLKQPQIFTSKVKPYLKKHDFGSAMGHEQLTAMTDSLLTTIKKLPQCVPYLKRAQTLLTKPPVFESREPWATVVHNDCWVNNCMIKYDETSKKPSKCKLVDYQVLAYGSPAIDVIFFLFTSVKNEVLRDKYEELIRFYYERLINLLESFNIANLEENFNFKSFEEELATAANESQFGQICLMLTPIFLENEHATDVRDLSEESMKEYKEPSQKYKNKLALVFEQFVKRGWI